MKTVPLTTNLIANLKRESVRRKLTDREMAVLCGIHYTTLSRILNGRISPTLETCELIAQKLGYEHSEKLFKQTA